MNKKDRENKIECDSCGLYKDKFFIYKHISGNNYCEMCIVLGVKAREIRKQVNQKEVDKIVEGLLKTPPQKKTKKDK